MNVNVLTLKYFFIEKDVEQNALLEKKSFEFLRSKEYFYELLVQEHQIQN